MYKPVTSALIIYVSPLVIKTLKWAIGPFKGAGKTTNLAYRSWIDDQRYARTPRSRLFCAKRPKA